MHTHITEFEVLVIGSGIAGLSAAKALKGDYKTAIITKGRIPESATAWAQGGIACAYHEDDSWEGHYTDTISAGHGLCHHESVKILVQEGPRYVQELIKLGTRFDRDEKGFRLGQEGAHSKRRILHAGDTTGREIEKALGRYIMSCDWVQIFEKAQAHQLIIHDGQCEGCWVWMDKKWVQFSANHVILATGGAAQVFSRNTGPTIATGDGVEMAYEAGAMISDMEFFQYHPTAIHLEGSDQNPLLISEAIRGEGARLLNQKGEPFMQQYHKQADLAPRDVVTRAIFDQTGGAGYVWLDASSIRESIETRFPYIYQSCLSAGINPHTQHIPVSPAAHYMMGGVWTNTEGQTTIPGLYAAGEVANLRLHGANRLASNSLLEGLVFGHRVSQNIIKRGSKRKTFYSAKLPQIEPHSSNDPDLEYLRLKMWEKVGISRHHQTLSDTQKMIQTQLSQHDPSQSPYYSILKCAQLMTQSALLRTESRGSHFREDYPNQCAKQAQKMTICHKDPDTKQLKFEYRPIDQLIDKKIPQNSTR